MTKNLIKLIVTTMVLVPVMAFASPAPEQTPINTPPAGSSSSTATPPTGGSSSTGTPASGTSGSTATPPTSGSISTASPVNTPTTPPSGGSSSGSNSISSSGSYVGLGYTGYVPGCPLITSYMKYGANNDSTQVIKLQNFLKNIEKLDVEVNGIFDKKTENAVKAFQSKYSNVTMAPWGGSQPTGFVYITTLKKINQIACNQPLTLNPNELSIINSYKNRATVVVTANPSTQSVDVEKTPSIEIQIPETPNEVLITSETNEENTASVSKTSIINKFWNFIVYLFK